MAFTEKEMERLMEKPWGYETPLYGNRRYDLKELRIREGHRLSLQVHESKHETWLVLEGEGAITLGTEMFSYKPGKIVDIPPKTPHRIFSGKGTTVIFEVSTPEFNDITRLEDDYGRV